jgi:hypothetical protein
MEDNEEMQDDFDKDETFDIQRPHFEANFVFDVIPEKIEAVLTAIVALTKCSKTWFLCKGTPQEIIKAAAGGALRCEGGRDSEHPPTLISSYE